MEHIFVFGSNKAGIHGAGAALYAHQNHGAEWGVGEGLTGHSYALPTKDENITTMGWQELDAAIGRFCDYARMYYKLTFLLTPVGTGLAGWSKREVGYLFRKNKVPSNVYLTWTWLYEEN